MDLTRAIDIYCERLGPGLLVEPLNAVTNAAFLLAAWIGWREARRRGRLEGATILLLLLLTAIGVGSTLFHTFAQAWASLADTIPIGLFVLTYLALAFRRFFGMSWAEALTLTMGFVFFSVGLGRASAALLPEGLGGSAMYLPALVALLACGGLLRARAHPVGDWLVATGGLFAVSLTFRSIDRGVCDALPIGTHFLWHLLNATVLGLALFAWIRHGAPRLAGRAGRA